MVSYIYCSKRQSINGKEFDTYKVGTVANSTSTMHKLMSKPITRESFEMDDFCADLSVQKVDQSSVTEAGKRVDFKAHWHMDEFVDMFIEHLEDIRQDYIHWKEATKLPASDVEWLEQCEDKAYHLWKELVRWLPESWLQTRTVTLNYENLLAICSKSQRRFHKLNEWSGKRDNTLINFISWARTLPYAQQFIFIDELEFDTIEQRLNKAFEAVCRIMESIGEIEDKDTKDKLMNQFELHLQDLNTTVFMD